MYPSKGGASPAGGFTHPPVSEGQNIKQDKFSTDSGAIDSGFHSGQNFSSDNLFSSSSSVPAQGEAPVDQHQYHQSGNQKQPQEEDSRTFDSGVVLDSSQHSCSAVIPNSNNDQMRVLCKDFSYMQLKPMDPQAQRYLTLEKCFQQNEFGDTVLHLAILRQPNPAVTNTVYTVIKAVAPYPGVLDAQNDEGRTPLHFAVQTSQRKVVKALVGSGASVGVRDIDGNTPLHLACILGYLDCAEDLLIPPRQDLEQWNYNGKRCVHIATEKADVDMLRLLVANGADINSREGTAGQTALHIAIEYGYKDVVEFLLTECPKLRLETTTYAGLTAYQHAALRSDQTLLQRLKSRGAEPLTPPQSDYEEEDSEEDEQMPSYYGSNAFGSNFVGLSTINVA
ncbi:hypothetical protein RP20_CCG007886 [Aedes albopictus]|nr:NF-kappa-B inhibitor cactus-like [Aedes albopictus]KXJ73211.1 hypothetical protein RP20_CCG016282 [Aedes albopictus]KXJ77285.1 hypothetical protein RP20_CCG007886 [Aedes albopictus]